MYNGECLTDSVRLQNEEEVTTRLFIDSRDRNTSLFPDPNRYDVTLDRDIRDVHQLRLVSASMPHSAYLISKDRDKIHFSVEGGAVREATLETGDYSDGRDMADEVERSLNASATEEDAMFSVAYESRRDGFSFAAKRPFVMHCRGTTRAHAGGNNIETVTYKEGSVARVLGFGMRDVASQDDGSGSTRPHVLRAPFRKNFQKTVDYIALRLAGTPSKRSMNPVNDGIFAVLHDTRTGCAWSNPHLLHAHVFDPPVWRFNKLALSFHAYDGALYDFQNQDHCLELAVVSRKQKRLCPI